jgi:predicted RNase H-like HicB family nuclease
LNPTIEFEREVDGRWIAEIPEFSGVMAYGDTREEAEERARALLLRVIADRIAHGEWTPETPGDHR